MLRLSRVVVVALLLCAVEPAVAESEAAQVHVVQSGQRLGSIAKRYNVSVDALCRANGITQSSKIRPGQRLTIPSGAEDQPALPVPAARGESEDVHVVQSGQRLGSIAKRYNVSLDALLRRNNLSRRDRIKPGDRLYIPHDDGETVPVSLTAPATAKSPKRSWRDYSKRPRKRGYVTLSSYNDSFRGYATRERGKVSPAARKAISRVLSGRGRLVDERLVQLLAQVSDQFGGRPIRIVSGYRSQSWYDDSRHRTGQAVDFSIPGVPNEAIRDYLRTLPKVGVGYYPNSSFVHLDVRSQTTYWVDYSGPGEAPRLHASSNAPSE